MSISFSFISLCTSRLLVFEYLQLICFLATTQLLDSNIMLNALRVSFDSFGHTKQNTIFRLVKLLADLSTSL